MHSPAHLNQAGHIGTRAAWRPMLGLAMAVLAAMPAQAGTAPAWPLAEAPHDAGQGCLPFIAANEAEYGIPAGFLRAVATTESGRIDPRGRTLPWPWTVNAGGRSLFFASRDAAVSWVRAAQAGGEDSIDVGCMQVNLHFHPAAFSTLEAAFDPRTNVRYAAAFLTELRAESKDWLEAGGKYHSRTPELARQYRTQVAAWLPVPKPPTDPRGTVLRQLAASWAATLPGGAGAATPGWTPGR